jgi:hypothetical protein
MSVRKVYKYLHLALTALLAFTVLAVRQLFARRSCMDLTHIRTSHLLGLFLPRDDHVLSILWIVASTGSNWPDIA